MNKDVYIVTNYDTGYSIAAAMTEEQQKAIKWFIEVADLEYSCEKPSVENAEQIK